ncbi:hypothetical protein [Phycicoccus flavus]|uniref:hypothetical protein n=1 Tax=Phycicoccus flavus TaxID=2502783 RepID=UPI000FEB8622|nr:hypothetical protein [Phycicoccus flavus]NHA70111.1 hypothetical protein [Phycicoccus flavus]
MNEIEVISDGDGVALIGDVAEIDRFLAAEDLPSRDLGLPRLSTAMSAGSGAAQAGAGVAANSGRWIKLTEESAKHLAKLDPMKGSGDGLNRAVMMQKGKTKHILEFVSKPGARSMLTNPAVLAGAAGIMAQLAMQQTMDEITDYLAVIDAKVDDVLRAQKDAVVADMIGVDFVIEEAMMVRGAVGHVSEVTWSKVQATSLTIARTQAYALRQLDALALKLEQNSKMDDLADVARKIEAATADWIAVLARCFQLQDAIAVLELDRVLDAHPDMLEQHRLGVRSARDNRRDLIARTTIRLVERMDTAAGTANAKVLLHPMSAKVVLRSTGHVATSVVGFLELLGIRNERTAIEARRWADAAGDVRDRALATGAEGVQGARTLSTGARERARAATSGLSGRASIRGLRRRTVKGDDPAE